MSEHIITDIHSHILFGIDDGATCIDESVEMLKKAEAQGVKKVFCTPHYRPDMTNYDINFALLEDKVRCEGIDIKLCKGVEILCTERSLTEVIRNIKNSSAKTMNNSNYVLLEMIPYMSAEEIFACVKTVTEYTDKTVILAHIERYSNLYGRTEVLSCLKEMGCLFQVNAYSLKGEREKVICDFARKLLMDKTVDFIGSDAHRKNHRPPKLLDGVKYIYSACDKEYADAVCFGNAEILLQKQA